MTPSVLKAQLAVFIRAGRAEALRDYLLSLRNADFRLAGAVLAEKTLWDAVNVEKADADFWTFATVLIKANSRAFLGTMLKAAAVLEQTMPTAAFAQACTTPIDCRKALEALLPFASTAEDVSLLLQMFQAQDQPAAASGASIPMKESLLFRVGTSPAYFVLFNLLKQHEDDAAYLRRFGVELIRKGDKRSFNLACIIKEYFDLPELPGTFSLSLQPYELSRLETNYDSFLSILNK